MYSLPVLNTSYIHVGIDVYTKQAGLLAYGQHDTKPSHLLLKETVVSFVSLANTVAGQRRNLTVLPF